MWHRYVRADGDKLVIRGPRKAGAVARRLLDSKPAILGALLAQRWGDAAEAVEWFMVSHPPTAPFVLVKGHHNCPAVTVTDPERWWRSMAADVGVGPGTRRDAHGAVRGDLLKLHALFSV